MSNTQQGESSEISRTQTRAQKRRELRDAKRQVSNNNRETRRMEDHIPTEKRPGDDYDPIKHFFDIMGGGIKPRDYNMTLLDKLVVRIPGQRELTMWEAVDWGSTGEAGIKLRPYRFITRKTLFIKE